MRVRADRTFMPEGGVAGSNGTKPAIMNGKKEKRGFFGLGRKSKADKPQYDGAMRDGKACGQVCSYMQSFSHLCYTPALPAACALAS